MKTSVLATALMLGCFAVSVPANAQDLPAGPGKALTEKVCAACHGVDLITNLKHTKAEWKTVIDTMVGYGAMGTDEELDTIATYLAKNFGREGAALQKPGQTGQAQVARR
jgi:virginiamycin B lyase